MDSSPVMYSGVKPKTDFLSRFNKPTVNQLLNLLMSSESLPVAASGVSGGEFPAPEGARVRHHASALEKKRKVSFGKDGAGKEVKPVKKRPKAKPTVNTTLAVDYTASHHDKDDNSQTLCLDDEDHEWFRTLFRSSITPQEQAGTSFNDTSSNHDENFAIHFPFSPKSPMFYSSTRLTPNRRVSSHFFSPDVDPLPSPHRENHSNVLHRNVSRLTEDITSTSEDALARDNSVSKSNTAQPNSENNPVSYGSARVDQNVHASPGREYQNYEEYDVSEDFENPFYQEADHVVLPSIPSSLLTAPLQSDHVHIRLDPLNPMQQILNITDLSSSGTADKLPKIPDEYFGLPALDNAKDTDPLNDLAAILNAQHSSVKGHVATESGDIQVVVDEKSSEKTKRSHFRSQKTSSGIVPEGIDDKSDEAVVHSLPHQKTRRRTLPMLTCELLCLLDLKILTEYDPSKGILLSLERLQYLNNINRSDEDSGVSNFVDDDPDPMKSSVALSGLSLKSYLKYGDVAKKLSEKDIADLSSGKISATNLSKVLGESHHRRIWELLTMLEVLNLVEVVNHKFLRRSSSDVNFINKLAILQNEAIFQYPGDAIANCIVSADFFSSQPAVSMHLQSVLVCNASMRHEAKTENKEYNAAYYYKEVLKLFLCGLKLTIPQIRRTLCYNGLVLTGSGERRLYDAVTVLSAIGLLKPFESTTIICSQKIYTWAFYDLKSIRSLHSY